jgi:hypothetical protein
MVRLRAMTATWQGELLLGHRLNHVMFPSSRTGEQGLLTSWAELLWGMVVVSVGCAAGAQEFLPVCGSSAHLDFSFHSIFLSQEFCPFFPSAAYRPTSFECHKAFPLHSSSFVPMQKVKSILICWSTLNLCWTFTRFVDLRGSLQVWGGKEQKTQKQIRTNSTNKQKAEFSPFSIWEACL